MSMNKESSMPLYIQLAETIKEEIHQGIIKAGETIGSQRTLEKRFDVSTVTVRRAIQLLKNEELVITNHGKGTFAKPTNKVEQNLVHLQSFSEIMQEQGLESATQIKKMKIQPVVNLKENILPLEFGERYLHIERVHLVDQKPIALAVIYVPAYIGEKITIEDLKNHSIYWLLENKFKIVIGKAEQTIEACPANSLVAELLNADENTPLLKAERISFSTEDLPVEKIEFYYLHSAYSFRIFLNRADQMSMWP
ncbi:GntR family transcriptional regulator [Lentibacillus sp. N15]|uniref:GntR family transcriptional regulator n=1 Tax=Lentibacillus songyuanensis TaxID=3136161 RepID=UPI0031BA0E7D